MSLARIQHVFHEAAHQRRKHNSSREMNHGKDKGIQQEFPQIR